MTTPQPIHFLLAEDDDAHAELIALAMEDNDISNTLDRVQNGAEALAYVRREGAHANARRPDVILLDLNMPQLGGLEVLEILKGDPDTRTIPVVILTTSAAESDRALAYHRHANSYLVKPVEFDRFHEMVRELNFYWGAWNESLRSAVA